MCIWQLLGEEPGTIYRYRNGNYITDRMIRAAGRRCPLGTGDSFETLSSRYQQSKMPLLPLEVYGRSLSNRRRTGEAS